MILDDIRRRNILNNVTSHHAHLMKEPHCRYAFLASKSPGNTPR